MRAATLLKSLAVTGVLVLAADHVAVAATGQSLVLGKVNKAGQVTTIERTTAGPALNLVTKPGKPPLQVKRAVKVKRLNADRVDGLSAEQLGRRPLVTSFGTTECTSLPTVPSTFTKITDIATISKEHDQTLLRLDLANRMRVESMTGDGRHLRAPHRRPADHRGPRDRAGPLHRGEHLRPASLLRGLREPARG